MKKTANFLLLAVALLAGAVSQKASGQAQAPASGPGSYISVGGIGSIFQADYGKQNIVGYGGFVDINPTWRYGIEGEARWLKYNTDEEVSEANYFIGPRVSIRPGPLRPYVKLMVGAGHIVLPYHFAEGTVFTVAPGGGVEYMLNDRWAVRVADFEYQIWDHLILQGSNVDLGAPRPYGVSAGISFRINGLDRYPKHAHRAHGRGRMF